MKNEKETKAKLLSSAKKEFMEKGYMQASLRNICKNAGVTTGALYFFFEDKEDLFASLVEAPLHGLYEIMKEHYAMEMQHKEIGVLGKGEFLEDFAAAKAAIQYMYQYYDEFQLLLTKGQGSRFEHCIDQFVDITERHYRLLADKFTEVFGGSPLEDYLIHWLSHMQIDTFAHMLIHEPSEEVALSCMEDMVRFMLSGWMGLFQK